MADQNLRAAIYARVSSDQQAEAGTIASQVDAMKERVSQDGLAIDDELCFLDDGYSGAILARPALERFRDVAATGAIDRVYVHSPDRLARKHAYQVLLVEELSRCGVEVVFLNHDIRKDPEGVLLLQVQGMIAEYERAKILERSRRGKLHAAQRGSANVLSGAPYGYRYVTASQGDGETEYRVYLEEARVVRRIFEWIGKDRLTIGEVKRRLQSEGIPSPKGKEAWDRTSIWGMLRNPAYKGLAAYGKTRAGERRGRLRPVRGSREHPRRGYSTYDVPRDYIPVPPIVSEDLFESVQEQLAENRRFARRRRRGAAYLLQGLIVCTQCGYALYGKGARGGRSKKRPEGRRYGYYRCIGSDAYRFGGQRLCGNKQVRTDLLEDAVWTDVCGLLSDPERVEAEFRRRLDDEGSATGKRDLDQLRTVAGSLKRGIARLIDAYSDGLLEKSEFEPRIARARERLHRVQTELKVSVERENQKTELKVVVTRMEDFSKQVKGSLQEADWNTQREILRSIVKRVEVADDKVRVVYRVDPRPFVEGPSRGRLQHCWRGDLACAR
jgi:site-specific DNA recombinase